MVGGRGFPAVQECRTHGREGHAVVASLEGALLRSRSAFPYFMLVALEAGSPLRAVLLLLLSPLVWLASLLLQNDDVALRMLVFLATAGLRLSDVAGVSKAVLPKFYLDDLCGPAWKVFSACGGKRYVLASSPRVMVEYFLKAHVGRVDQVFGSELQVTRGGRCTGLLARPGVLLGQGKADIVKKLFGGEQAPDVGLGGALDEQEYPFLCLCKERYVVRQDQPSPPAVRQDDWEPLVFHDGRLVVRPTPFQFLVTLLWSPAGFLLALMRISVTLLPMELGFPVAALLGVCFRVKGAPPLPLPQGEKQGILFACTHRSLMDPTYLAMALRRKVKALTYSVSRVSEIIAPIRTACLTRDREQDARLIGELLAKEEDLFVCPEGTTCREPYLLRFSSLFAELTEHVVPVAMRVSVSMFYGTSARGFKSLDAFFFLMNPRPVYEIIILDRLRKEDTVAGGKTSVEVARLVQRQLAQALGYGCTDFTRKDKYTILAGHDGTVKTKRFQPKSATHDTSATAAPAVAATSAQTASHAGEAACRGARHDLPNGTAGPAAALSAGSAADAVRRKKNNEDALRNCNDRKSF